ncbi:MAG: translocation/assembly module TamB domain-containing protein [Syntrophobacteraceae bacterium]
MNLTDVNHTKKDLPHKARFVIRLAALGAAALLFVVLLPIIFLHVPPLQKEIIRRGVARVEAATNFKVQIRSYRWWPFSGINFAGVKIESEGKQILDCDKVHLKYRLSIKRPYIIVEEVYLEKPFLHLERSADGKWQVPASSARAGQGSGPEDEPYWAHMQLPRIQIVSGTIEARQQGDTILSVKDISGAVNLKAVSGAEGPKILLEFQNVHAHSQTGQSGTWDIQGSGVLDEHELYVRSAFLSGPDNCRMWIQGQWDIGNFDNGKANLLIKNFSADSIPLLQPHLSGLSVLSGKIAVTRSDGRWSIDHDVSTDLGSVKGILQIEKTPAGAQNVLLDSRFTDLNVHLSSAMPDCRLNGRMEIKAGIQRGNLLDVQFTVRLDRSTVGAETIQSWDLNGTWEQSVLTVRSSALKCSLADLKFSLIADLRGLSDVSHKGGVTAEVSLEKGNLEKINSRLNQKVGGLISVEANYNPGNFTNPRLWQAKIDARLNIPEIVSLKGSGTFNNGELKADYDLDLTDAQKIALLVPQWQGKGRVSSRGTLNGKWPDLFWDGEINSPRFQYSNYQADQLAVKGKGKLTGKEDRREISLKAQNVVIDGRKLASINVDLDQQKNSCSFRFNGDGMLDQLSARLSGKLDRIWEFPLVSVSTQGQLQWKELGGTVDAKFDIEHDGIKIHSASLQHGRQKISASGGAISESRAELSLSVESINATQLCEMLGIKDRPGGTISGQIQVSGRPDEPEGKINIQGTGLTYGKQQIEALTLQGNYSKNTLIVQGTAKAAEIQNPMAISAKIPVRLSFKPLQCDLKLSEEFSSDVKISGLKAEALLPYLSFLTKAGGQLEGDIHCAGSLKQPVVSGAGTWKDGLFQQRQWLHPAEHIETEWQADSKNLYVRKAEVSHLGGTVTVTGQIDYPKFSTLQFKADGKDLQVSDIYGIEGKVSGHAEIKDNPEAAELTGKLLFSKAQMNLGKLETDIAQNIEIIEPNTSGDLIELKTSKTPSKFSNRLTMDVELELPQNGTWVNGKSLKAEINGGLWLKKTPDGPVTLVGELHALRGTYNFQGKELKIVEGSLVFMNKEPDPELRIICRKEVRDVTVQALIAGPLSHPKLVLSSVPAMNQVDILSYFMFDRPAGDLTTSQSSQLQGGAASWLGSESSNMIKSVMGNHLLAPDAVGYRSYTSKYDHRFDYDESQAATGKETDIVEIGKDITPDLHVTYGKEIKGEEGNEVQVEYRANRGLSLRTQVGAEQTGVDIFWRHDFGK